MEKKYVKQLIWEAFNELSAVIPFDKLTVEKIISRSGVSKATFYRYFRDKYDVMNYNSMAVAKRIIGGQPCKDWHDFLLYMFWEIEREMDYYRRAFKTSGQNAHSRFLLEYSFNIVRQCYMKAYGLDELSREENYMLSHYCHGCVATIEDWLRDSDRLAAEQMAELFYNAMPEKLRGTWSIPDTGHDS